MEMILEQEKWFDKLAENPVMGALSITINNIKVGLNAFLASALVGIGGLIILCFNGLFIGAIFGYCQANGFHHALGEFVLSHGPLELSIIIAAAFAGLIYGRVFFQRPYRFFGVRLGHEARRGATIIIGTLPWLILAGFFEGFISPFYYFNWQQKLIAGLLLAAIFWFWTFMPQAKPKKSSS
jgi:uncharacterized membrane protein SpoIIM required for sporulation